MRANQRVTSNTAPGQRWIDEGGRKRRADPDPEVNALWDRVPGVRR